MRKKQTMIATAKEQSKGPLILTRAQQHEFNTARKHPEKGGYPRLKAMFKKHGFEPQ